MVGVTAKWNQGYQYFKQFGYQKMFMLNNDILVPNGVIPKLSGGLHHLGFTHANISACRFPLRLCLPTCLPA
jgi:hypothetical protein